MNSVLNISYYYYLNIKGSCYISEQLEDNLGVHVNTFIHTIESRIIFCYIYVSNGSKFSAFEFNYHKPTEKEINEKINYLISTLKRPI